MIEVFELRPEGFVAQIEAAACYVECDGCILLLQQAEHKSEPGRWGVPAGKKEGGETIENTAKRELFEETGILASGSSLFQSIGSLYMRKPELDYIYYMFSVQLQTRPVVQLSAEHNAYYWASWEDLGKLPLMLGAKESLVKYRSFL